MVRRALDELLDQRYLVDGAALHDGLCEQVTGELHLAEHTPPCWVPGLATAGALLKSFLFDLR